MSRPSKSCDSFRTKISLGGITIKVTCDSPPATTIHADDFWRKFKSKKSVPLPGIPIDGLRMLQGSFEPRGEDIIIHVRCDLPPVHSWLPDWLHRLIHPAYLTRAGYGTQLLQYQLFDGLVQIANLEEGQTAVHASAVEKNGYRVVIIAGGGMGKTGSLLRLVGHDSWSYLSDDWTTLARTGFVHRSRKPVQLYPRNLSCELETDLLHNQPFPSRLAWQLRKRLGRRHGLRRKIGAEQLFGDHAIGAPGRLGEVFFIERGEVEQIIEWEVDAGTLARQAGEIVTKELAPSMKLLSPYIQTISRGKLASLDTVAFQTVSVLQDAVSDCKRTGVKVPQKMPEKQIEDYIVDRINRL